MEDLSYVLITAVRDEETTIGITLNSMMSQTRPPAEWVIVSDGSTDRTDVLIQAAAQKCPWIKLVQLSARQGRSFAAMVRAINTGVERLECRDYGLIGLLDGDLRFQTDYFAKLVAEFGGNSRLGLAGGMVVDVGHDRSAIPRNKIDVPGAVQLFRRDCYEKLNGYFPIPEGGFDAIACAHARMLGYETKLVTSLVVDHLKPRNSSAGGTLRRKWQLGVRDYALGYHPIFESIKCLSRIREQPVLIGSAAWWLGYLSRGLRRAPRMVPDNLVAYIRREQMSRLLG